MVQTREKELESPPFANSPSDSKVESPLTDRIDQIIRTLDSPASKSDSTEPSREMKGSTNDNIEGKFIFIKKINT